MYIPVEVLEDKSEFQLKEWCCPSLHLCAGGIQFGLKAPWGLGRVMNTWSWAAYHCHDFSKNSCKPPKKLNFHSGWRDSEGKEDHPRCLLHQLSVCSGPAPQPVNEAQLYNLISPGSFTLAGLAWLQHPPCDVLMVLRRYNLWHSHIQAQVTTLSVLLFPRGEFGHLKSNQV